MCSCWCVHTYICICICICTYCTSFNSADIRSFINLTVSLCFSLYPSILSISPIILFIYLFIYLLRKQIYTIFPKMRKNNDKFFNCFFNSFFFMNLNFNILYTFLYFFVLLTAGLISPFFSAHFGWLDYVVWDCRAW